MMRVGRRGDEGAALVVALAVMMIVSVLTLLVLQDSFHNVFSSGRSRERLTAIAAAEAGLAWYLNGTERAGLAWLQGAAALPGGSGVDWKAADGTGKKYVTIPSPSKLVPGLPGGGSFAVEVAYDTGGGCVFSQCNDSNVPTALSAEVTSTGRAGETVRKVWARVVLSPQKQSVSGAVGGMFVCKLGNRLTITGPSADVYLLAATSELDQSPCGVQSDVLQVTSGQFTTSGSVYVPKGGIDLQTTSTIGGSVMALGQVRLGKNGTSPSKGKGCSSQAAPVVVCGDAVSNTSVPTVYNAKVFGSTRQCAGCAIPSPSFPTYYRQGITAPFPSPPWVTGSLQTSLTLANLNLGSSDQHIVEIDPGVSCAADAARTWPSGTLTLVKDLVVVSPCGFKFSGRTAIQAGGSYVPTLYLLTYAPSVNPPFTIADCKNTTNLTTSFSQNFDATDIRMFVYTPCQVQFFNQVSLTGQIIASSIDANGQTTIKTVSLAGAPPLGLGTVASFKAQVLSLRESS